MEVTMEMNNIDNFTAESHLVDSLSFIITCLNFGMLRLHSESATSTRYDLIVMRPFQ